MTQNKIFLYDLAGADQNIRFSPPCWAIKLALKHKRLNFETIAWRFTDSSLMNISVKNRVPVLVDGFSKISNSWDIALHLDKIYIDNPLMRDERDRAASNFVNAWAEKFLQPAILPFILMDIFNCIDHKDKKYFRDSREKRLGATLEGFCFDMPTHESKLFSTLEPLSYSLSKFNFLGGASPNYSDYIIFGRLQWARVVSSEDFIRRYCSDPIKTWFNRLLELYDGFALKAPIINSS